jgi:ketosteroid isomerase-like protein
MSQENVEIVRQSLEAFRRRDAGAIEALWHPDGEFRSLTLAIEGGTFRLGRDAQRYLDEVDSVMEEWHSEDEQFIEVDEERVVLLYRVVGRGKGSRVPISQPLGAVFTLRGARITLGEVYLDQNDALEAVGLSEQDAHAD